jgi:SSS family solute:Na+ symporter/sodium/pantothenate symporter
MRYLNLVSERPVIWMMFLAYLAALVGLTILGRRKARRDVKSFAIGKVSPVVAGMTIAASLASTATFVINPGFVYAHGVSALIHLGVAAVLGMSAGLWVVCARFRKLGGAAGALTLPQWIGQRYGSRALRVFFAAVNLLTLCFVVLIVGGLSIVMQKTLGLSNLESIVFITVVVFGYVFAGGAYAHAYANTLQAAIKGVVAVMILVSGLHYLRHGIAPVADHLRAIDPDLVKPVNPSSSLFGSWFSVYASGFIIGFALMCQPHIMAMSLYVEDARKMKKTVVIAIVLSILFATVLLGGIWARMSGIPDGTPQDRVMTVYLAKTFSPAAMSLVTVALLAAGMSAMSAILMALSSIAANDLVPLRGVDPRKMSRWILLGFGAVVLLIAYHPPHQLGIFGQLGAYGVVSAAAVPIVLGVLVPSFGRRGAFAAALIGPAVHFGLYFVAGFANPAVTATIGILAAAGVALGSLAVARLVATESSASVSRPVSPAPTA